MKSALAMMALACAWTVPAFAQAPASRPAGPRPAPASGPAASKSYLNPPPSVTAAAKSPGTSDPRVFRTGTVLPAPLAPDEVPASTIVLPTEPLEPYLLTKDAGPFMVNAYVFRGPDATRYAQALAIELRKVHHLPRTSST
jgi:hypothetical protein